MGVYVIDNFSTFWEQRGPWNALANYDPTTTWNVDIRSYGSKVMLVKNSGTAPLTFTVLGSIDDGAEYDITELADTTVAAGGQYLYKFDSHYTDVSIQIKGVGGIGLIKFAAAVH